MNVDYKIFFKPYLKSVKGKSLNTKSWTNIGIYWE